MPTALPSPSPRWMCISKRSPDTLPSAFQIAKIGCKRNKQACQEASLFYYKKCRYPINDAVNNTGRYAVDDHRTGDGERWEHRQWRS